MNQKISFAFNAFFLGLAVMMFIDRIDSYPASPFWGSLAFVLLTSSFVVIPLLFRGKALLK